MLSYSGLSNYGKASLPSVKGWNGSLNVKRDPPKSLYTKRLERVGDTNRVMNSIAHSEDRYIESINYYARGVNPMVSVTYGEGQTASQTSSRGQAYLPYRIMKDGAFRPPIKRQEDILPLSRLPRKWVSIECNPTELSDTTKRLISIGKAEQTQQVKNDLRNIECQTRKIIQDAPAIVVPLVNSRTRDEVIEMSVQTNPSNTQTEQIIPRPSFNRMNEIVRAFGVATPHDTSYAPITERPPIVLNGLLNPTGHTNPVGIFEKTLAPQVEIKLSNNLPIATAYTNTSGTGSVINIDRSFNRLPQKEALGEFLSKPYLPQLHTDRTIPILKARR